MNQAFFKEDKTLPIILDKTAPLKKIKELKHRIH
ncbi:hypothetical protein MED121_12235 [Marinomonas sp. MED121]|nr:hypothetical protein MED121_12235 [Marinomonas sp. MED121]